jgi:hypothetical protein
MDGGSLRWDDGRSITLIRRLPNYDFPHRREYGDGAGAKFIIAFLVLAFSAEGYTYTPLHLEYAR